MIAGPAVFAGISPAQHIFVDASKVVIIEARYAAGRGYMSSTGLNSGHDMTLNYYSAVSPANCSVAGHTDTGTRMQGNACIGTRPRI